MGALTLVLTSLSVLEQLLEAGTTAYGIVTKLNVTIQKMKDENRDPTQEEWDEMHAELQKARDELNQDE